jgi:hypothetical protein
LYIWESTPVSESDHATRNIDGLFFKGVQLRELDEVIEKVHGQVIAVAPFSLDIFHKRYCSDDCPAFKQNLAKAIESLNNKPYDSNPVTLLTSSVYFLRFLRPLAEQWMGSTDWLFCSEMVAEVYKRLGFIGKNNNTSNCLPMDFLGFDSDIADKIPFMAEKLIVLDSD